MKSNSKTKTNDCDFTKQQALWYLKEKWFYDSEILLL